MAQCECGYGIEVVNGVLTISPHAMDCPRLKEIVALSQSGVCVQCGETKTREKRWDDHMQMVVHIEACPNGHSHGMNWMWPTDDDIRELGLVASEE